MKKILAILIAVVMAFAMLIPAAAGNVSVASDNLNINDSEAAQTVFEAFGFLKTIYDFVHNIVHTLSEIFDFDCPFYHEIEDTDTPDTPDTPVVPDEPVDDDSYEAIEITAAELAKLLTSEVVNNTMTVELNNNYKVTDEWTSLEYPVDNIYLVRLSKFTFNGNGHVIAGLTAPLFAGNIAADIEIKDLTIADSNIANGNENGLGRGAILAYADSNVAKLTFENCTVKNTEISAEKSSGALVGNVQQNDLTIKDCTAKNVKIDAKKSVGGIVGFCMTDKNKTATIEGCKVTGCDLIGEYVGQIAATVNGDGALTIKNCDFTGDACDPARMFATVTIVND